jgi:NUMOD3 motif
MFYVYKHLHPTTKETFYVGKGSGKRAFAKHSRNKYWNNKVASYGGFEIEFIAHDVEEELAFLVEVEAIDLYKRIGCKLANITNGGEGTSGMPHTEATKRKIAEKATGRPGQFKKEHVTDEMRQSVAESNKKRLDTEKMKAGRTFKGKTHTEEHKAHMSKILTSRVFSEETKKKMQEAQKKRWANRKLEKEIK